MDTEKRIKYRGAVSGMTDRKLASELKLKMEMVRGLNKAGISKRSTNYSEAIESLQIVADEVRERLGTGKASGLHGIHRRIRHEVKENENA